MCFRFFFGNKSLERYETLLIYGMFRLLPSTSLILAWFWMLFVSTSGFWAPNVVFVLLPKKRRVELNKDRKFLRCPVGECRFSPTASSWNFSCSKSMLEGGKATGGESWGVPMLMASIPLGDMASKFLNWNPCAWYIMNFRYEFQHRKKTWWCIHSLFCGLIGDWSPMFNFFITCFHAQSLCLHRSVRVVYVSKSKTLEGVPHSTWGC